MKKSPITPLHEKLGATMSCIHGWCVPEHYTDLAKEHLAARSACAVFDVSHLCKFCVQGEHADVWMDKMFADAATVLNPGFVCTAQMLNRQGVIIDKVTIACQDRTCYYMVGSSAQEQINEHWLRSNLPHQGLMLRNDTESVCAIALSGPESQRVFLQVFAGMAYPALYRFGRESYMGEPLFLSRSGLFDKHGIDIYCPAQHGIHWFEALMAAGAVPCGMKTREHLSAGSPLPIPPADRIAGVGM